MKNSLTCLLFLAAILFSSQVYSQTPQYSYVPNLITLNTIPLNSTSNIRQNLYYPTDFNSPSGMITKLYLGAGSAINPSFTPLTIKVGPSSLTTFTSGPFITGLTTVFSSNVTLNAVSGWYEVILTTPFFYNNTQNLIVEISQGGFSNSNSTPMASSTAVPSTTDRTLYGTTAGTGTVQPRLMQLGFSILTNNNDLSGVAVIQPVANSQNCPLSPLIVRASIKNMGALSQSNFPVNAYYSGAGSGTLSTVYTGTLLPGVTDTVNFPATLFVPGAYSVKAAPALASDTSHLNDTTAWLNFVIKPYVPNPAVNSDTVCTGGNAFLSVNTQANTTYNWYSGIAGGTLLTVGNSVSFTGLAQDTVMYVSAVSNGCESGRVPIGGIIGAAPVVNLGPDTSFCQSMPLILDGGNPGGSYLWSTGDTTQSIALTSQSGAFWVEVDKYCLGSDTINVAIDPLPVVNGISYVRMNNTYQFNPSGDFYVQNYLWIFGDGATSTLKSPLHTYFLGQTSALIAQLIVSNECGTDTAFRTMPTDVSGLEEPEKYIDVYPNPANDNLVISSEHIFVNEIIIVNMLGKTVLKNILSGSAKEVIDVSHLVSGNYIIRINTDKGNVSRKLEIKR